MVGNGVTDGDTLDRIAKKIFGSIYQGIRTSSNLPPPNQIKNNTFYIVWKGEPGKVGHWLMLGKKNGKAFEFDSYELEELSPDYINYDIPDNERQTAFESNCGARVLSQAMKIFNIKK